MRIHLVEPLASGHRLQFLRRLLNAPRGAGVTWSLSTFPSTLAHPAFAELAPRLSAIHQFPGEAEFVAGPLKRGGLSQSAAWWDLFDRHWQALPADARGDAVLVPFFDYCLYAAAWRGLPFAGTPTVGIAMRPSFHYRAMGVRAPHSWGAVVQKFLLTRLLTRPGLRRLLTIDEPLAEWLRQHRPRLMDRVAYIQDPSDLGGGGTREEGRARYGVRAGQRVVLAFGSIARRKGVDALIAALADPGCPAEIAALVVGRWEEAARPILATPAAEALRAAGRLHVCDSYVDAKDEQLAFAAADAVWLGYRDFYGSSGVLMQAAQAGLPVIGCRDGLVGWTINRHGLGEAVDPDDGAAVRTALLRLLGSAAPPLRIPDHLRHPPAFGDAVLAAVLDGR